VRGAVALAALLLGVGCRAVPAVTYEAAAPYTARAEAAREAALAAAKARPHHRWRDEAPRTQQGYLRGLVEIGLGDRDKREYAMASDDLVVDRVLPEAAGGFVVNYGFVPQTIAFDGDPLDVLVLGPRIEPGRWAEGVMLGVLHMRDEKGEDPKVVVSPVDEAGAPRFELTGADKARIGAFFEGYKRGDAARSAEVYGWGGPEDAERLFEMTHRYFEAGPEGLE